MAENNGLEAIQEKFENISEILDAMRVHGAETSGIQEKILTNISLKLESLSENESADLIRVFLSEMKKNLDDRHNFVALQFSQIEKSVESLAQKTDETMKAPQLKEVFDIIATNLSVFSGEITASKGLLDELGKQIQDFRSDDSAKKDILRNISVLKVELEKFNNGFQSIILNLNDNFKIVTEEIIKLDSSEILTGIKKDIENIYLTSNAVLSTLQIIDRKNSEFEEFIQNLATKEEFELQKNNLALLTEQSRELSDYVSNLPVISHFEDLSSKVESATIVIKALKEVLSESSEQGQKLIVAQLEKLEEVVDNILSEEDFKQFGKELFDLVSEGIKSSNLVRTDLLDTNAELKSLMAYLSSVNLKESFAQVSQVLRQSDENVSLSIAELSSDLKNAGVDNKTQIQSEISSGLETISQKIEDSQLAVVENSKNNVQNILENIQNVISNLFSLKNELKAENLENVDVVDAKFQEVKEDLANSNEILRKQSRENLERIISNINEVSSKLEETQSDLAESSAENRDSILSNISLLSSQLVSLKEDFNLNSRENIENLSVTIGEISGQIESLKSILGHSSRESLENLSAMLQDFSVQVNNIKFLLNQNVQANADNLTAFSESVTSQLDSIKCEITSKTAMELEVLASKTDSVVEKIDEAIQDGQQRSSLNLNTILNQTAGIAEQLLEIKNNVGYFLEAASSNVKQETVFVSDKIDGLKEGLYQDSEERLNSIKTEISALFERLLLVKEELVQNSGAQFDSIKFETDSLADKMDELKSDLYAKSQADLGSIRLETSALADKISDVKNEISHDFSSKISEIDFDTTQISQDILDAKNDVKIEIRNNLNSIQELISALPDSIRENQSMFEHEKRLLIEQNAQAIEALIEKIQSLTTGIQNKDNPFKIAMSDNLAELKDLIQELSTSFEASNHKIAENLEINIQNLDSSIQKMGSEHDEAFEKLQSSLVEYLGLIKDTTRMTDLRLEDSVEEISQIKSEVQAIAESISILNTDGKVTDLASNINTKFAEVLDNIYRFEEKSSLNNKENIHKLLEFTEDNLAKVLAELETYSISSNQTSKEIVENISDKVSLLKEHVSLTFTDVQNAIRENSQSLLTALEPINESINELLKIDFSSMVMDVKSEISASQYNVVNSIKEAFGQESEGLSDKISEKFNDLSVSLDSYNGELKAQGEKEFDELKEILNLLSQRVDYIIKVYAERDEDIIITRISDVEDKLTQKYNSLKACLDAGFGDSATRSANAIEELISVKSDLLEEINGTREFIRGENIEHETSIRNQLDALIGEVGRAQEEISSYKLHIADILKIQDEGVKSQLSEVENAIVEELSRNIDLFKTAIETTTLNIDEKLAESEEGFKTSVVGLLSELRGGFEQKLHEGLDDLKSFVEVIENRNDYTLLFDNLKSDVFERFSMLADDIEESVTTMNVKSEIKNLSSKVHDSVSDLMENMYDKIVLAYENDRRPEEILENSQELARRIEDLKTTLVDDVADKLNGFELSIERQSKEFSEVMGEIRTSLNSLKEEYFDSCLSANTEILSLVSGVRDKVSDIDRTLAEYDFEHVIETASSKIYDEVGRLSDGLEIVNQKLDAIAISSDEIGLSDEVEELKEAIYAQGELLNGLNDLEALKTLQANDKNLALDLMEIKNVIDSQASLIENLKSLEKLEKLSKIDGVVVIQAEIKKILAGFEAKLNAISAQKVETSGDSASVKGDLAALKKEIVENLLNVFQQISFVAEAEDIKDFVDEKSQEIKSTIASSLGNNLSDIKNGINEVKRHLQLIQDSDEGEDYTYTLQDVESDIAKVRLILDDMAKTLPESDLARLNEDILSISTRTNKLLINSDESYNALQENLAEFKQIVYQLDEKVRYIDSTDSNRRIEEKLEETHNLMVSCVKSDKTFNEAFMYLAEWVDTASENLNTIDEKLEIISDKFESQQEKIEALEAKIEKLENQKVSQELDLKAVVAEVLTQVMETKDGIRLSKKVDSIERQLTKLGKNVEKLTSYVDED